MVLPTYHFGYGLSASLAILTSRGFSMTLHLRSTLPAFPSPPPHRGWQRSEHCSQSFAPQITPQHVWVGTPGHHRARSGSWSPSSILLHRPYEVSQEYGCAPPGHSCLPPADALPDGAFPPVGRLGLTSPPSSVLYAATTAALPISGCFACRSPPRYLACFRRSWGPRRARG